MQKKNPSISFIVPVFNAEDTILETLQSIVNLNYASPIEILIVDDGSSDRSIAIVAEWIRALDESEPRIIARLIQIEHGGEAAAMNAGIERAASPIVAWVESDVKVDREWLAQLLSELALPGVAGAGGLLLPAETDSVLARLFGYEIAYKIKSNQADAIHITSANALYKKEIFEKLGPCRTELGESSFDSEFNHRVRAAGFRLRCQPQAIAWHHFKTRLADCMKRAWWYGFRRPFVQSQVLYPFDRVIAPVVLSSSFLPFALASLPFFPGAALFLIAFALITHWGYSLFLYCQFRDSALLWSFPIFLMRNGVFLFAYFCGWIYKRIAPKPS